MQKLILLSILVITVAVPVIAARDANPRRGLRKALSWTAVGVVTYTLAVVFIYPRLLG
jgi:predicted membrane channel-forming protein YqfA (hemolysin III family)